MVSNLSGSTYHMANYLYSKFTYPPKENPRLDPLSTLVKLAILSKKPDQTKLSLDSNYITFTQPYYNKFIQAVVRWSSGDSYNDLWYLTKTLHKAMEWYSSDEDIKKIIKLAADGLERLKTTYGRTGKASSVQSYIDILVENDKSAPTEDVKPEEGTLDDVKLHQILKEVWTKNDVKIILGFFDRISNADNDKEIEYGIDGIEVILKSNHSKIEEQIKILSSI